MGSAYDFDSEICRKGTNSIKWDRSDSKFGETDLLPLWIADTDFAVPAEITEAARKRLDHPVFGYSAPPEAYYTSIVDWFRRRHGLALEKDWIVAGNGVITSVSYSIQALTSPGDRVLIQTPVYDPFQTVIRGTGRTVVESPLLCRDNFYEMDLEDLEKHFRDGVRMMILCNPHNPVGRVWKQDELRQLAELCSRYHVYLISDEIHCDFGLAGHRYTSVLAFPEIRELAVSCVSPGKSFNLSGLCVSSMLIPHQPLRERIQEKLRTAWLLHPDILAMEMSAAAYTHGGPWMDAQLSYLEENSLLVQKRLQAEAPHIRAAVHEGTFLMWLDFRDFSISQQELTGELVHTWHLGLNDGSVYGREGNGYMRLNIGCTRRLLNQALDRLVQMDHFHF